MEMSVNSSLNESKASVDDLNESKQGSGIMIFFHLLDKLGHILEVGNLVM